MTSGTGSGPPTIVSIAERAGVSIASVSRVLNGLSARRDTEEKVRKAAAELGYVPNSVARSLKGGRTRQLTFAMPDIGNPVYVAMVREIQAVAKAAGYRLLLHSTDAVTEDELAVVRSLAERTSDGLIICPIRITPQHVEAIAHATAPVVVIGSPPPDAALDCVQADSVSGAQKAVWHLADTGRRRIAFINGPLDTVPGRNRDEGYRKGLADHGLGYDPELTAATDFAVTAGAAAAHELLDRRPDLDAIFCANDQLALGAAQTLHARGMRVPEDVAVAGMDDTLLARAAWPPLTSVDLGSAERGRIAAELLLERLREAAEAPAERTNSTSSTSSTDDTDVPPPAPRRTTAEPRLVVRESTVPARSV
ncbi:LacI family transcriptional regulator [Streptomyces sp. A7024]|uniref:LacI family transcriptional regulator n=1 Tax=Streptomyces coryli TaxID=1128680 RepID=A0A6G4UA45_9ACTN|nr:LacI family transcriptional regulator [Streptomyces coryli]